MISGATLETDYPYLGYEYECNLDAKPYFKITGQGHLPKADNDALL